ncbi:MAG: DUF1080 domain-containing protein [Gemmataceae bacterium]|nr:DUF1080 domain-containing protein [Gemmataceae bacterium]
MLGVLSRFSGILTGVLFLGFLGQYSGEAAAADPVPAKDWITLFNGKNLDGWTVKIQGHEAGDNFANTFLVEDGILKVSYKGYKEFSGKFGHLFYKDSFSHYLLRVEYRFVGDQVKGGPGWATRNSGVMFHCQSPQSMGKDQDFPVSIEAQFLGGLGKGERPTGNVCTPGTNVIMKESLVKAHCTNSKSKTYNGDQWVTAELEVRGSGKVRQIINGETVLEYEQCQLDPKDKNAAKLIKDGKLLIEGGYIALQAESHPVEFRKVEIRILSK